VARALLRSAPMRLTSLAYATLATMVLAGCQFYFHSNGDDDDACQPLPHGTIDAALLNPETLTCEDPYQDWNGGCYAPDRPPVPIDPVDWAFCTGSCTGLTENSCLQTSGCRAAYTEAEVFEPNQWIQIFGGCYATATSGPVRGGDCSTLGAGDCSRHDDCAAVHASIPGEFERCEPEPTVCQPTPGPVELLRDPASGKCESYNAGGGGCGVDPPRPPDWGLCGSPCEELDEGTCKATSACRAIYIAAEVPPGPDGPYWAFKACWPTAPSGPARGGSCEGLGAEDCSRHDDCVAHHQPDMTSCPDLIGCDYGVGAFAACASEAPPAPCPTLDEDGCIGRSDCEPLYTGSNCSCTPSDCTCHTWTFDTCQARS
jgi:hypothetical protein